VQSSASVTIYAIRTSRGHEVAEDVLGADFEGTLVVDGWSAYDVLSCKKGRCNAHILRRCRDLLDQGAKRADTRHLDGLIGLLRRALALAEAHGGLAADEYERRLRSWEGEWIAWHARARRAGDEVQKLRQHLLLHEEEFTRFLFEPGVPATNNHGERMLRPAVVVRKAGGCNRTLLGACVHGVLASLMASVRQQGKRFLELALQLWRMPEAQALPLETWPDAPADAARAGPPGVAPTAAPSVVPTG
jgi:transposase